VIEKSIVPARTGIQLRQALTAVEDFFHPDRIVIGVEDESAAGMREIDHPIPNAPVSRVKTGTRRLRRSTLVSVFRMDARDGSSTRKSGGSFARSRCFQSSGTMTCSTCHDEHAPERAAASYSNRCLTCHEPDKCGMYAKLGAPIATNCIDCHMPVQQSKLIVSDVNGRNVNAMFVITGSKFTANLPATEFLAEI